MNRGGKRDEVFDFGVKKKTTRNSYVYRLKLLLLLLLIITFRTMDDCNFYIFTNKHGGTHAKNLFIYLF